MIPVQAFLPDALAEIIRGAPMSPEKVAFAWRTAVGPSLDRVTTVRLANHVLIVRAQNAAWQREIERSAALIRVRLESLLGRDVVRGLRVITDS